MITIGDMAAKEDAEIAQSDFHAIATYLSERSPDEIDKARQEAANDAGASDEMIFVVDSR